MKTSFTKIFIGLCILFWFAWVTHADKILVENLFSDIDANYIYRDELQKLYDRGMIIPDGSWKFWPNEYLNRDEFVGISMEVICERCIQPHTEYTFLSKYTGKDVYFDIDETNPYFYCVAEADAKKYVRWYDAGEACQNGVHKFWARPFCPINRINREEAIAVLLRNSGIFTIFDNQNVISQISNKTITQKLWNDVNPTDADGNPYTFYGYIRKALEYEIVDYDEAGNKKILKLLFPDDAWNIKPDEYITKEEFLRMSYIALKSNSCTDLVDNGLALRLDVFDKACSKDATWCSLSDLHDEEDTYDFKPHVETTCESWVDDPTGYIWRFHNLNTGEQIIKSWWYIDDYTFLSSGEWRVYVRVIDTCGNTSEVYVTIFVPKQELDQDIDVDIDVYDDACSWPLAWCEEIEFEDEEDDGDDIFDFDGDVNTSCEVWDISYDWTFTHTPSGRVFSYSGEFIDNFDFTLKWEWIILLEVVDGCGQTGSEVLRYIVVEDPESDAYIDVDIDVYDDACSWPLAWCEEIEFEDEEDDGDDIFDFDGDVNTSCEVWDISYDWTFTHIASWEYFSFSQEFVDNFDFLYEWEWKIILIASDACGQSWQQQMTYIVKKEKISLNVWIQADPIFWPESLLVDFEAIVSWWRPEYIYEWDFWDGSSWYGKNIDHVYDAWVYTVTLTVTDALGNTGSATVVVQVMVNTDKCLVDSDGDFVVDCDDLCPTIQGDSWNMGCPFLETTCSWKQCSCPEGYTCSDTNPLTCTTGVCVPDIPVRASCLYTPWKGSIFGWAMCNTCPCNTQLDFLADIRKCDIVFPAITSPWGDTIFSRGTMKSAY